MAFDGEVRAMDEALIKGKWQEIKGEIQRMWGKLTGDELEETKGNLNSIAGIIEQKYGARKEQVSERLEDIMKKYKSDADLRAEQLKAKIKDQTEHVKKTFRNQQRGDV
jgi:uncharacterized protein YjbJ (UPF0337 family)